MIGRSTPRPRPGPGPGPRTGSEATERARACAIARRTTTTEAMGDVERRANDARSTRTTEGDGEGGKAKEKKNGVERFELVETRERERERLKAVSAWTSNASSNDNDDDEDESESVDIDRTRGRNRLESERLNDEFERRGVRLEEERERERERLQAVSAWTSKSNDVNDDKRRASDEMKSSPAAAASKTPAGELRASVDAKSSPPPASLAQASSTQDDDAASVSSSRTSGSGSSSTTSSSSSSASSRSNSSSSTSTSATEIGQWEEPQAAVKPTGISLKGMLTRQNHIRNVAPEDVEYFTPTDSDDDFAGVTRGDGVHHKDGTLTPPMSPKSKTRYRCIKGELAARKSRTEGLRAKHSAARQVLEAAAVRLEEEVSANETTTQASVDADLRLRTSLFAKRNGLSPFPVCTCNGAPKTTLGATDKVQYASYCQVHFPFAAAKMGTYETSHSEAHVEEATQRLREIYLQEQEKEILDAKKKNKLDFFRGQFSSLDPDSHLRYGGDSDDSDWDLANVAKTLRRPGGPPLVIPNPHIERSKRRIQELREANGYQIFETRTHYMIISNNAYKSLYRVAKIERFSDEFTIDEDPFLFSHMQIQNLLKMAAQSQQGCKLVSSGTGIVGFIQLYNFESAAETGLDLDGINDAARGDTIRITEEIYRKHVRAMKRKELMFAFLERTKAARGAPSYLQQLGSKQGYTLFSGADKVRPIGEYGRRASAREIPTALKGALQHPASVKIGVSLAENFGADASDDVEEKPATQPWYARLLESIDANIGQEQKAKQKELDKLKRKTGNTESDDEREAKKKEEEEAAAAAALAMTSADWTRLILEGFIVPEIPTDNALPGKVLQVSTNKYIYRTKYLTVFKDLDPSEDEDEDEEHEENNAEDVLSGSGSDSNGTLTRDASRRDAMAQKMPSKMSIALGKSVAKDSGERVSENKSSLSGLMSLKILSRFGRSKSKGVSFKQGTGEDKGEEPPPTADGSEQVKPNADVGLDVFRRSQSAAVDKAAREFIETDFKRSHSVGFDAVNLKKAAPVLKVPSISKPTPAPEIKPARVKENSVTISSKNYAEDLDEFGNPLNEFDDTDDDTAIKESDSEASDDVPNTEFIEYTLIERVLIFLGFMDDTRSKKVELDSDDDEPGFISRMFSSKSGANSKNADTPASDKKENKPSAIEKSEFEQAIPVEKATLEPTPTMFRRENNAQPQTESPAEKKPQIRPMTAEEIEKAIEERRLQIEAAEQKRIARAKLREEREKERKKAQARINRYRFDPDQPIVKLRFKSFGSHAPLLL